MSQPALTVSIQLPVAHASHSKTNNVPRCMHLQITALRLLCYCQYSMHSCSFTLCCTSNSCNNLHNAPCYLFPYYLLYSIIQIHQPKQVIITLCMRFWSITGTSFAPAVWEVCPVERSGGKRPAYTAKTWVLFLPTSVMWVAMCIALHYALKHRSSYRLWKQHYACQLNILLPNYCKNVLLESFPLGSN